MASQTINVSGWTSLGAGPLKVEAQSSQGVWIKAAASQPSGTVGDFHLFGGAVQNFETGPELWALPAGTGACRVGVTPINESYETYPHAYAQATSTTSAKTLAQLGVTIPTWATLVFVVPSAQVRYRADGTDPTSSIGMPIAAGQAWPIQGKDTLAALKIIGSATLDLEFRG